MISSGTRTVGSGINALNVGGKALRWRGLDDVIMGGKSASKLESQVDGSLLFGGIINTDGGGFCSIRAPLAKDLLTNIAAIRLKFVGDGKTYKLVLVDGSNVIAAGPSSRKVSWQADIPTKESQNEQELTIQLRDMKRSIRGPPIPGSSHASAAHLRAEDITEVGFMLSLYRSDGSPNPTKTFGSGIFEFGLEVVKMELIHQHD